MLYAVLLFLPFNTVANCHLVLWCSHVQSTYTQGRAVVHLLWIYCVAFAHLVREPDRQGGGSNGLLAPNRAVPWALGELLPNPLGFPLTSHCRTDFLVSVCLPCYEQIPIGEHGRTREQRLATSVAQL